MTNNLLIRLPQHADSRGVLTVAQDEIPFRVERVFWLTDIPVDCVRGEHLHSSCHELIACVAGQFTLVVDDGQERTEFVLDAPDKAVWVPANVWCRLQDWHPGTVVCVMASEKYDEKGYDRNVRL